MRECVEEGILQAYVDDELSPEMTERVAAHISACQTCAGAASLIATETAMFASAFEAEKHWDVPTVSLRERIDAAIAEKNRPVGLFDQRTVSGFGGWLASISGLFKVSPQRSLGFASLIAVVAFAAIFGIMRWNGSQTKSSDAVSVADNRKAESTVGGAASPSPTPTEHRENQNPGPDKEQKNTPNKRPAPKKPAGPVLVPSPDELPKAELATLPGEHNYLKAIDSLMVEIQASGETTMKPSLRSEYERNLAIVDQAINSTRRTARRNPNDPDATEFLYSSYQSKIDLLSTIAEQVRPTLATR
jgi:hypothetical protein